MYIRKNVNQQIALQRRFCSNDHSNICCQKNLL